MVLKDNVIDNWANALTKIAVKENKVKKMLEQAHVLIEVLKNKNEFVDILTFKSAHDEEKRIKIIDDTFSQFNIDEDIMNAFKILVHMQAFVNARDILKKLRGKLVELDNMTYGVVWSTEEISAAQIKEIEEKMSKKINKEVKLVNKIDTKLIAGIQVVVHNKVYDGSLRSKLDEMKYQVLKEK
ncbi:MULTISPECIES: F0F1 ATP synthase subunit delta [Mesoplasma]|uniref:ATP synthase subunit delta n=2 Tax=Mesoplasma florum TaxID=2151 RepID=ATPD_MESFL|nr:MULTISPECIES: F0F1 ATP synthase subunit delta [Mesoplasma]Q6F205.1 RecName: Full=ATP synthase subunit delta; AltName: Full=ATP synthase F(1) sector subunit delta; AltName: Full=F-type ATPase subunit delta; Short=F-ATPase subunit delta [Mesoplasma florum L1]AAT75468.1 ATP synthase delta chain [Mesoplasma florum L1]AGY41185.1 ATP synthase delta chain [Mesoplasma florum W37]ATI73757.1 ATP synthase subunit delta [Mesoplasma florum]AVN58724.1 ATP synthase subunit delta [Mesoplasma florum]AVN594